ncbi:Wadjet anti-phage system protein JetD domain-containing protein [Kribbella sp. NPDC020789]
MKAPADIERDIETRLKETWAKDLSGTHDSWPYKFGLGVSSLQKADFETGWTGHFQPVIQAWREWVAIQPANLETKPKQVYTTTQDIPSHLEVADIDAAAAICGDEWPERLARGRNRLALALARFPHLDRPDLFLRRADTSTDLDFDLLLTAAAWFIADPERIQRGVTPRQIPIPGVHAKWLQRNQAQVRSLTRLGDLGLLPRHPARVHFSYLDPEYRRTGARIHDSATVGDNFRPAYQPTVVIVSENKDTAIHFPAITGGISVEGAGFGGKTAAAFDWLINVPHLIYWGDIDAYGFEILNGYREDGVPAVSILMDSATYKTYERFGTNTDAKGNLIKPGLAIHLPALTKAEYALYARLREPAHHQHRRIEQERIPLAVASSAVQAHLATPNATR